ncbi:hypothetical protein SGM_4339 [Streptomyces griseoaurantiacus M045]|uniref:Uncharacterized protein n=1 Tax=Streptomyces griseoaurantiacus M045 TaxID=996637 RepID=F3NMH5_9ACTN|nr:hypothetical protein SGM_4339 [Streptomyces griseoaurantiacus M045]
MKSAYAREAAAANRTTVRRPSRGMPATGGRGPRAYLPERTFRP